MEVFDITEYRQRRRSARRNHAQRQDILQLISTMDEKRWRLSFFLASDILIGNFAEVRII
jgi:hypothetical protein